MNSVLKWVIVVGTALVLANLSLTIFVSIDMNEWGIAWFSPTSPEEVFQGVVYTGTLVCVSVLAASLRRGRFASAGSSLILSSIIGTVATGTIFIMASYVTWMPDRTKLFTEQQSFFSLDRFVREAKFWLTPGFGISNITASVIASLVGLILFRDNRIGSEAIEAESTETLV